MVAADFIKAFPSLVEPLRDHINKLNVASLSQDGILEFFSTLMNLENSKKQREFKVARLDGKRYLVCFEDGHAYHRKDDGGYGNWAGIFTRTPKVHIDTSVPEPNTNRPISIVSDYWVNNKTGHTYHRNKDGSIGNWAGIFYATPTPNIDTSASEPEPDEDDTKLEC